MFLIFALPILFSLLPIDALAGDEPTSPSQTDAMHGRVSKQVFRLANRIDSFFGDKRSIDAQNKSSLVVSGAQDFPEGGIPPPGLNFSLNLKLINLEAMGRRLEDSVLGFKAPRPDDPDGGALTGAATSETEAPPPIHPWRLVLDQQIGAKWPPTYSSKLRLTKDFDTGDVLNHFLQEYGWDTDNLWNSKTNLTSDIALSEEWLFRWSNDLNIYFSRVLITSSHGPSFVHTLDEFTSMSYNLRLNTEYLDNRLLYTSAYVASINYRRDLYKRWVFLDLGPSLTFPREKGFARVPNFAIRLEVIFGSI